MQHIFTRQFADLTSEVETPAYAQQGIFAIKRLVIVDKKFEIAPRIITMLSQIKVQRFELNDAASIKTIDEAVAEIKSKVKSN